MNREVVIAHVADSSAAPRVDPLDVGFHQAAHALAFGKVMLASLAPADRPRLEAAVREGAARISRALAIAS